MFSRGVLFIAVLIAALFVPYYLSESKGPADRATVGRWWDSMWTDPVDGRMPMASTSPIPKHPLHSRPVSYGPVAGVVPGETPTATPYGPANGGNSQLSRLPAGATGATPMATPWVPVNPQAGPNTGLPEGQASMPGLPATGNAQPGLAQPPRVDVRQLISFDITPDWVLQNWSRVSTEIWKNDLAGMRVPLISGTSIYDLAGSLTYYFDEQQTLEAISFQGTTGDATFIKSLVAQLGLTPRPSFGGATMVRETEQGVSDMLRVRPMSQNGQSQFQRYEVLFELTRPGSEREVSQNLANVLKSSSSLPSLEPLPTVPTELPAAATNE